MRDKHLLLKLPVMCPGQERDSPLLKIADGCDFNWDLGDSNASIAFRALREAAAEFSSVPIKRSFFLRRWSHETQMFPTRWLSGRSIYRFMYVANCQCWCQTLAMTQAGLFIPEETWASSFKLRASRSRWSARAGFRSSIRSPACAACASSYTHSRPGIVPNLQRRVG